MKNLCALFALSLSFAFAQVHPASIATEASVKAAVNSNARMAAAGGYLPKGITYMDEQFDEFNYIGVIDLWRRHGITASNPGDPFVPTVAFVGAGLDCVSEKSLIKNKCDPRSRSFIDDKVNNDSSGADTLAASVCIGLDEGNPIVGFTNCRILALQVWRNRREGNQILQEYSPDVAENAFRFLLAQPDPFIIVHVSLPLQSTPSLDAVFEQMRKSGRFYFVGGAYDQPVKAGSRNELPCSQRKPGVRCVASVNEQGIFIPGGYGPNITGTSLGRSIWAQGPGPDSKVGPVNGNFAAARAYTGAIALLWGTANARGRQLTSFELDRLIDVSLRFEARLANYYEPNSVGVLGVLNVCDAYELLLRYLDGEELPVFTELVVNPPTDPTLKPGIIRLTGSGFDDQVVFQFNGAQLNSTVIDGNTVDVELSDALFNNTAYSYGVFFAVRSWNGKKIAPTYVPFLSPAFLAP